MFTVFIICLAPTVMFLTARLFSRRRAASRPLALLEWAMDASILLSLTLLFLCPLRRVSVSPWTGHPLSFVYGKTAAAFSLLLGVALGALQGLRCWRWTWTPDACRRRRFTLPLRLLFHLIALFALVLTLAYLWGVRAYPVVSMEEIAYYLYAPLEGTAQSFVSDVLVHVALPAAVLFALLELLVWLPARRPAPSLQAAGFIRIDLRPPRGFSLPLALLFLGALFSLLFACLDRYLDLSTFVRTHVQRSVLIENEYVDPAKTALAFPEQKRNLITIYMESAETTFQDRANGGVCDVNYMPEMTRIALQNVSFSQSERVQGAALAPGTGWTTAGLLAQTTGLPLKVLSSEVGRKIADFLPGATSLGDILRDQGYTNVFMVGSNFTFGGRRRYFVQHGDYEIWDLFTAYERGLLPQDYYEGWGFEDRKLYAYAKDMLAQLAASGEPFHLSLLTVDTHVPGYVYECCPEGIADPYLRVVACSSRQLDEFLSWCEGQPFFENTTVVVTGDHASMVEPSQLDGSAQENDIYFGSVDRLVYNAFVNAAATPAQTANRRFTTLDFFPTVLASIGVSIEGERLGLGTNLFSSRPTLAEEYGYDTLFTELSLVSDFYNEHLFYPQ